MQLNRTGKRFITCETATKNATFSSVNKTIVSLCFNYTLKS